MSKFHSKHRRESYFTNGNVEVRVRSDEDASKAIKRFCKKVKENGILDDFRKKSRYEKPSQKRRRKRKEAKYRADKEKARK